MELGAGTVTVDFYSEDSGNGWGYVESGGNTEYGQTFTCDAAALLDSCKFLLYKVSAPTGNATALVYAHTGTYGTDGVPTGSALATSGTVDVSGIAGYPGELTKFTFSGAGNIQLSASTHYVVILAYSGGDASNMVGIRYEGVPTEHDGNHCYYDGTWSGTSARDVCFYVYGDDAVSGDTCCATSSPLTFGNVDTNTTATDSFYIYNCGDSALVDSIDWAGLLAGFTPMSDSIYNIASGVTTYFVIEFDPPDVDSYADTISLGHANCDSIIISGTGTDPASPCCAVYTSPLAFGSLDTGQTDVDSFYIKNCGGVMALNDSIDWTGLLAGFTPQNDSAYNISAGDSQYFSIQFAPTAVTSYQDVIDLGHDSCGNITITGTGSAVTAKKTIYISPDGNDLTGDGTKTTPYKTLEKASEQINGATDYTELTGDTIILLYGTTDTTYSNETTYIGFDTYFRGKDADNYLVIMGDPSSVAAGKKPVYDGNFVADPGSPMSITQFYSNNFLAVDDAQYILIKNIKFKDFYYYGINIDDGGGASMGTAAHHITIDSCDFETGEGHFRHGLKMSGVDTFEIKNCTFSGIRYNSIDGVGIHDGTIHDNIFRDCQTGLDEGNGVMLKGGSRGVDVYRNYFYNLNIYGVQIGQTTDAPSTRPAYGTLDAVGNTMDYEAKDIDVYRNLFVNVSTPIKWDCSRGGRVYQNTFFVPQPNDSSFGAGRMFVINQIHLYWDDFEIVKCRDGEFRNNIIYYGASEGWPERRVVWVQNPGPEPETFIFSDNMWHCTADTSKSVPDWTTLEGVYGSPQHWNNYSANPLFAGTNDSMTVDSLRLQSGSPAIGIGNDTMLTYVPLDYDGNLFADPPSLGALEGQSEDTCCATAPVNHNFGLIDTGSTATHDFTASNCGDSTLYLSIELADSTVYTITSGGGLDTLVSSELCTVTVLFSPDTANASYLDTITLGMVDDIGSAVCSVVPLSGGGINIADCSLSVDTIAFDNTIVNQIDYKTFYVYNVGVSPCDTLELTISEACATFGITSGAGVRSILDGDSLLVTTRFQPSAASDYACTLQTGCDSCGTVPLSGTGIASEPEASDPNVIIRERIRIMKMIIMRVMRGWV